MEPITFTAVGDICLGDSAKCLGFGTKSVKLSNSFELMLPEVESVLYADIVFGNLESVLSEKGLVHNDFHSEQLRGHPQFANYLASSPFNILNIANNHIMQHGAAPFWETVSLLRDNGLQVLGKKGDHAFSEPVVIEAKGRRIGFLGYSFEDDIYGHYHLPYANTSNKHIIISDIKNIRGHVDWLFVSLHWGVEFMNYPSPIMIERSKEFVDSGVDVILGHHPHVVQPVTRYNGSLICYSLGNFIFDMVWCAECMVGSIVKIILHEGKRPHLHSIIPVGIDRNTFCPALLSRHAADDFFKKNEYFKKVTKETEVQDIEKANIIYYNEFQKRRKVDMVKSNIFLLSTLFGKTPVRLMAGKLKYIFSKLYFNS